MIPLTQPLTVPLCRYYKTWYNVLLRLHSTFLLQGRGKDCKRAWLRRIMVCLVDHYKVWQPGQWVRWLGLNIFKFDYNHHHLDDLSSVFPLDIKAYTAFLLVQSCTFSCTTCFPPESSECSKNHGSIPTCWLCFGENWKWERSEQWLGALGLGMYASLAIPLMRAVQPCCSHTSALSKKNKFSSS